MTTMMMKMMLNFRDSEDGATLVEYGIAVGLAVALGGGALAILAGDIGGALGAAGDAMPAAGE